MIQAKELRISNIVGVTYGGNSIPPDWKGYKVIESGSDIDNSAWYHAIPLTEEWLLRLGFDKSSNGLMFFIDSDGFSHIEKNAYGCNGNYGYCLNDERVIFKEIKYVHQLQNLYFARTGEELTIKE